MTVLKRFFTFNFNVNFPSSVVLSVRDTVRGLTIGSQKLSVLPTATAIDAPASAPKRRTFTFTKPSSGCREYDRSKGVGPVMLFYDQVARRSGWINQST